MVGKECMPDHKLLVCYLRNSQASTTKLNSHALPHIAKESLYWLQRSPCGRKSTFKFINISKQACLILATMHLFRLYYVFCQSHGRGKKRAT